MRPIAGELRHGSPPRLFPQLVSQDSIWNRVWKFPLCHLESVLPQGKENAEHI